MNHQTIPNDEIIKKTAAALQSNGMEVIVVENRNEAKTKVLDLIPANAEVLNMTSLTLDTVSLATAINESGQFSSVRNRLNTMDSNTQASEKRKLGAAPDYAAGSVHAVTQQGQVVVASNTGSQLPAYAYGSQRVIWVVGAQKIVPDLDQALKRTYDYVLPLESERAKKAYGSDGSNVSKLLIVNKEVSPGRITVILVKEALGF